VVPELIWRARMSAGMVSRGIQSMRLDSKSSSGGRSGWRCWPVTSGAPRLRCRVSARSAAGGQRARAPACFLFYLPGRGGSKGLTLQEIIGAPLSGNERPVAPRSLRRSYARRPVKSPIPPHLDQRLPVLSVSTVLTASSDWKFDGLSAQPHVCNPTTVGSPAAGSQTGSQRRQTVTDAGRS
jgi:hypothetical protein